MRAWARSGSRSQELRIDFEEGLKGRANREGLLAIRLRAPSTIPTSVHVSLLDLFFKLAVPFTVFCVIIAKVGIGLAKRHGVYSTAEGEQRRDEINRKHRTNRGAAIIATLCALVWILMLFGMIESMGAKFATFLIWALLALPFGTVCTGIIMLYLATVHGLANFKASQGADG